MEDMICIKKGYLAKHHEGVKHRRKGNMFIIIIRIFPR